MILAAKRKRDNHKHLINGTNYKAKLRQNNRSKRMQKYG